ncbi:hypothetical protein V7S43_015187 [Phytophthora oleae]|uniref:Uncharacterized protein n=1 Tax=Phytophthora oleae TaxID=2107226 RepID=A0ABD3F1D3_9STRA
MVGVASMLCRLGVRPSSISGLAFRAVADFMATLAFVTFERDAFLSSYTSEPVLTFGAVNVWYECKDGLVKYILPQLKKLILSDVVDSGGVGEMVACILMLLAMDKCVMDDYGRVDNGLIGQLVPVEKFLAVLQIEKMQIYKKGGDTTSDDERPAFNKWLSKWEGWYMGFTHFVQLVLEPDEETLWYLLGRRAAGVSPRGQNGADLLIPMFRRQSEGDSDAKTSETSKQEVSLMLVQVKDRSFRDSEFTQAASKQLSPSFLFDSTGNPLSKKADGDVIRIYMDIGEEANGVSRFIMPPL